MILNQEKKRVGTAKQTRTFITLQCGKCKKISHNALGYFRDKTCEICNGCFNTKKEHICQNECLTITRFCKRCHKTKSLVEFGKNMNHPTKHALTCSKCAYANTQALGRRKAEAHVGHNCQVENCKATTKFCNMCKIEHNLMQYSIYRYMKTAHDSYCMYNKYKRNAMQRDIIFNLTVEKFWEIAAQKCFYCLGGMEFNGIDRVNNATGYSPDNCVPCCHTCNIAKGKMSLTKFLSWLIKLTENNMTRLKYLSSYLEEEKNGTSGF